MPTLKNKSLKAFLQRFFFVSILSFLSLLSNAQFFSRLDIEVLRELSVGHSKNEIHFMHKISQTSAPISLSTPVLLILGGMISHDKTLVHKGVYVWETITISSAITLAMKYAINRQRPFNKESSIPKNCDGGGPSFPSGHTSFAFATATSLSFAFPKWYVIIPSYLWAGTIGYSRMYLGVHYPSDVLAGAIVGTLSGFLSYKLHNLVFKKKDSPVIPTIY